MKRILSILLSLAIVLTLVTGWAEEVKTGKQILFRNTENHSVELRYVDEAGNLVNGPYGYAIVEFLYEEGDQYPSKIRYLDKNGERVLNEAGYAVAKYTYKEDGTVRQIEFYNEKGRSFHPKAYIFHYQTYGEIYIGSSNISRSALTSGIFTFPALTALT